jgi:pimeloyl-ACP methyl ester carboxylesterase
MDRRLTVTTPDGRKLDVLVHGSDGQPTVVFHHGTPGAPVDFGPIQKVAEETGVRVVNYARPGYAESTEQPGRDVAAAAADVIAIADALGVQTFATAGASGGGPHALACVALHPDRCRAAATVAGVGPYNAPGLDFLAGMGPENVAEFGAAVKGVEALTAFLDEISPPLVTVTPEQILTELDGLLPDVDRRALEGEIGEFLAAGFHAALRHGIAGWRDDDLAFAKPWGFDLAAIERPVAVWQGDEDLMVPYAHGVWLADAVPTARPHLLPGHGHISIAIASLTEIVTDVCRLAGLIE